MATVLCYHGVTAARSAGIENFSRKHLPLIEFMRQIRSIVSRGYDVIPVRLFLDRLADRALAGNEIVLTFDDGYRNVYQTVWPLLHDLQLPFTIFVAPAFLDRGRFYWVDRVEHLINCTDQDTVRVHSPQGWRAWRCATPGEKITAVIEIKKLLKGHIPAVRDEILAQFQSETQLHSPLHSVPNYRCMSWQELLEMAQDPLVTVGSHSMNHEILSALTRSEAEHEIVQSRLLLENGLNRPVLTFAYPNGKPQDYNQSCIDILRAAGYRAAFKVVPDPEPGPAETRWLELPRVTDDDRDQFLGQTAGSAGDEHV